LFNHVFPCEKYNLLTAKEACQGTTKIPLAQVLGLDWLLVVSFCFVTLDNIKIFGRFLLYE
jgi:hypothetical protein